ncbi:hypothetical protein D3C85_1183410 [compost metagenome]
MNLYVPSGPVVVVAMTMPFWTSSMVTPARGGSPPPFTPSRSGSLKTVPLMTTARSPKT